VTNETDDSIFTSRRAGALQASEPRTILYNFRQGRLSTGEAVAMLERWAARFREEATLGAFVMLNNDCLCEEGKRLDKLYFSVAIQTNGEPTPLYYHIIHCEKCGALRDSLTNFRKTK
jgi:hypothetical protein